MTSLAEYVKRMKDKQDVIFYVAGTSRQEVTVLFLTDFFKYYFFFSCALKDFFELTKIMD